MYSYINMTTKADVKSIGAAIGLTGDTTHLARRHRDQFCIRRDLWEVVQTLRISQRLLCVEGLRGKNRKEGKEFYNFNSRIGSGLSPIVLICILIQNYRCPLFSAQQILRVFC